MANHQMPNMPGAAVMTDTLDFVKNLWGSMSVPGMNIPGITVPTLSIDELDKKINDLKAVETWLSLNMSMLRTTIQALEVQRGTIATIKSMGASLAAAVKQPGATEKSAFDSVPAFFQQMAAAAVPVSAPAYEAPAPVEQAVEPEAPSAAATLVNPAMAGWWNLMQDQFKQAVSTAMTSDVVADAAAKFTGAVMPSSDEAGAAVKKAPLKRAAAVKPKTDKIGKV